MNSRMPWTISMGQRQPIQQGPAVKIHRRPEVVLRVKYHAADPLWQAIMQQALGPNLVAPLGDSGPPNPRTPPVSLRTKHCRACELNGRPDGRRRAKGGQGGAGQQGVHEDQPLSARKPRRCSEDRRRQHAKAQHLDQSLFLSRNPREKGGKQPKIWETKLRRHLVGTARNSAAILSPRRTGLDRDGCVTSALDVPGIPHVYRGICFSGPPAAEALQAKMCVPGQTRRPRDIVRREQGRVARGSWPGLFDAGLRPATPQGQSRLTTADAHNAPVLRKIRRGSERELLVPSESPYLH